MGSFRGVALGTGSLFWKSWFERIVLYPKAIIIAFQKKKKDSERPPLSSKRSAGESQI